MKSLTIVAHPSNYPQLEVWMNTNQNITQAIWSCKFQNFGISQCLEIYKKFPFRNFVSKCVKDKLKQDA